MSNASYSYFNIYRMGLNIFLVFMTATVSESHATPPTSDVSHAAPSNETIYTSAVADSTKSIPFSNDSQQIPSTLQYYVSRIFSKPAIDMDSEKFTIVMMSYKRTNILAKVLIHYCKTPRLQEIVVIWNNVDNPVPQGLRNLSCEVPLKFIQETENRMTNRFKPRPEFETDCECSFNFLYILYIGIHQF